MCKEFDLSCQNWWGAAFLDVVDSLQSIVAVGGAVLLVYVAWRAFKWLRRAL